MIDRNIPYRTAAEQLDRLRRLQRVKLGIAVVCFVAGALLASYAFFSVLTARW